MISNIDQIKAAGDIVDIIGDFVKLKRNGSNMEGLCPFHSEKTPSFSVSKSKNMFKCFGCGKSGDAIDFLQEHENINYVQAIKWIANKVNIEVEETVEGNYEKPVPRLQKVADTTVKYFETRGISNNTLLRFGITESVEWMPIAKKEIPVICFNYFRNDELINIKYRGKGKDFAMSKNAELIFYNLDALKGENACVIVEGEIDCLSLYEAGIYNVVSVPNGASSGNMKYLDNCWDAFEDKEFITLFTDNDNPGNTLAEELARRLGKDRCRKVSYPDGCKDANDVLLNLGKDAIHAILDQAKRWPVDGVLTMDDLYLTVADYYQNGFPKADAAGIGDFDELLTFGGGQLTTITGSPGSGKSEFIDYISSRLCRNHGWKFAIASFENPAPFHVAKLMEKHIGLAFGFRKDPAHRMSRAEFDEAIGFLDHHYLFFNILQADVSVMGIINKIRELVLRYGIKGVVVDPWNYIEHKVPHGQTETQYISEALSLFKECALKNDIHIFIVAHPRKLQKDPKGQYPVATMYDISGSAHFFNKTDNGISVHRDHEKQVVTVYVQKVRFSWQGAIGFTCYHFDTFTRQYIQI